MLIRWLCLLPGLYLSGTITRPGMTFSGLFCKFWRLLYITPAWGLKWCFFVSTFRDADFARDTTITNTKCWPDLRRELLQDAILFVGIRHIGSEWNKWCESVERIAAKENISHLLLFFSKSIKFTSEGPHFFRKKHHHSQRVKGRLTSQSFQQ